VVGTKTEIDPVTGMSVDIMLFGPTNTLLETQIKVVESQADKNYDDRNK